MTSSRHLATAAGAAAILILLVVAPFLLKAYGLYLISVWVVMTIAAMGLNLTVGYAGQISLAQAAFVGIGAYTSAIALAHHYPFLLVVVIAAALCFSIGWVLGYPALRVQHHYLAFVTLGFSTLVYLVIRNEQWLTGGVYGISNIARPVFASIGLPEATQYYYICLTFLLVVTAGLWWLVHSPWGRSFVALRENPVRAASLGVHTRRYILIAFAIGSTLGGIAGALYAPLVQFIDPSPFALTLSLNLLLMVIVGGSGNFWGPFIGALVAVLLPEWLRFSEGLYLILYSLLVMILMAFCPSGLLGLVAVLRKKSARRPVPQASATQASPNL